MNLNKNVHKREAFRKSSTLNGNNPRIKKAVNSVVIQNLDHRKKPLIQVLYQAVEVPNN